MEGGTLVKSCSDQKFRSTNSIARYLKNKGKWELSGQTANWDSGSGKKENDTKET